MSHLAVALGPGSADRVALALYTPRTGRLRPVLRLPASLGVGPWPVALARFNRYLYVATTPFAHLGESEPSVLVFRSEDGLFEGRYRLGAVDDVRGMQGSDGILRIVSAGTGEMVALQVLGSRLGFERFTWAPTFDESTTSVALGLRSIVEHGLEVWMTALGPETGGGPGPGGFVFNLTRATIVARGLDEPGALASDGERLWMSEGALGRVRTIDGAIAGTLPGPPRGMAWLDGSLYAAVDDELVVMKFGGGYARTIAELPGSAVDLIAAEDAGDWPEEPDTEWVESYGVLLERPAGEDDDW